MLRCHLALVKFSRRELLPGAPGTPLVAKGETQEGLVESVEVNHVALSVCSISKPECSIARPWSAWNHLREALCLRYMRMAETL